MKGLIYLGIFVGATIGSYIPVLFGQDMFSFASIAGSLVGSLAGLWAGYKLGSNI
jgi:nitric oxide reductase activation protein